MAVVNRLRVAFPPLRRLCVGCSSGRTFGSSAAAQLQYDYDDDEIESNHNRSDPEMEESDGSVSGRGIQWVIMGDPLARRHVYAERLSKLLEVPLISMGTLVRQELNPRSALYKQIASAVNQGKLVPEDVIFALLSKRLEEGYCSGETGFILGGIPRTRVQAEILDEIADIDMVLNFKCPPEQNPKCGIYSPSQEFLRLGRSGIKSNLQSMDSQMKSLHSDKESAWNEKLQMYSEQSKPVEEYYRKQKKLLDFQMAGGAAETWKGLLAALHLQHMNALHTSSQKLTA